MPTNKPEGVLPELPEPYQHKVFATSKNTPSVRQGIEMSGYVKSPDLYTADQMRAYGQACIDTLTRPADGEFVMVPKEATPDMLADFWHTATGSEGRGFPLTKRQLSRARKAYAAMLSGAPQQHGQEVGEVESIGRAFLSVLGDPSIAWRNTGAHEFIERVSQATARQKSATPPAIDIGKLRELVEILNHAIATQLGARVTIHATRARQIRDELAALGREPVCKSVARRLAVQRGEEGDK